MSLPVNTQSVLDARSQSLQRLFESFPQRKFGERELCMMMAVMSSAESNFPSQQSSSATPAPLLC